MTSAASAPPETLERIFRYAVFGALDVPSKPWQPCYFGGYGAANAIGQVPLVNQHWNAPATRILYWELNVHEQEDKGRPTIMLRNTLLRRTLEESPHLQTHVRSLYVNLGTVDIKDREVLDGSSLPILRCCPLVQHLGISGWIPTILDDIHTTIATFTRLRYLYIRPSSAYCDPFFCSFERLEAMVKG